MTNSDPRAPQDPARAESAADAAHESPTEANPGGQSAVAPAAATTDDSAAASRASAAADESTSAGGADAGDRGGDESGAEPGAGDESGAEAGDEADVPGNEDHLLPGQTSVPVGDEVVVDDETMRRALEAILMVTDEPLPVLTLARAVGRPTGDVAAALAELAVEYTEQGRGFDLREVGGGWRYYTRVEAAPYVERFVLDGQQARLTQAALETLAVVAYKQPVSRARVSAIRGVNVDGVMRTLVARGLVEEAGADTESQATLYRTTTYFLERMGMQSLDDLPELAPYLPEMDDIEDELAAQTLPPADASTDGPNADTAEAEPGTSTPAADTAEPESDTTTAAADEPATTDEPTHTTAQPDARAQEPENAVTNTNGADDDADDAADTTDADEPGVSGGAPGSDEAGGSGRGVDEGAGARGVSGVRDGG